MSSKYELRLPNVSYIFRKYWLVRSGRLNATNATYHVYSNKSSVTYKNRRV